MPLSILIVDDHPLMSAALLGVLQGAHLWATCSVAHNGASAKHLLAQQNNFNLIVLDLTLPDMDGFDLLSSIRHSFPDIPLMVVSASESVQDMRRVIAAGAMGYVTKSASPATMLLAATLALRGEVYLPPVMANASWPEIAQGGSANGLLSERQLDVLRLMCAGKSNKFIAFELGVAEKTVKGRVTAIFDRLAVANRTQAVVKASKLGLFPLTQMALDEVQNLQEGQA